MSQPTLLIIDDEADICELIADIAETQGFAPSHISDPLKVESYLQDHHPQGIMMDLMMPGIDGVELLRDLGDSIKDCAIMLMSGHDSRVLNSARRLGSAHGLNIIDTVEKPIDVAQLRLKLEVLKTACASKAQRDIDVNDAQASLTGLTVNYQPIIEMQSGHLRGLEALARWQHPTHGLIGPGEFIHKLDVAGLHDLTRQMLGFAVRDTALLQQGGQSLSVSVNMTYGLLADGSLLNEMQELCARHKLPHDRLTIEITETEVMQDVTKITKILTDLRMAGFGLAIDDFGTGYSSLRELQRLPFSSLKMDKSFVLDFADSRACQVISHAIIELGHNLDLKVVAEGVETLAVWTRLKELGCDLAQGYFISKPLAYDALSTWLKANQGSFSA